MDKLNPIEWSRTSYLDASAAVKLVLDEVGSLHVAEYMDEYAPLYISSVCVGETLGVLKRKWLRGVLSKDDYFRASYLFLAHLAEGGKIIVENDDLTDSSVYFECEDLARKHGLDLSDALQMYALKDGCASGGILITADAALEKAARAEGLVVWNCEKGAHPAPSEASAMPFLDPPRD